MNKLIFATSNQNKILEISKELNNFSLLSLHDIGYHHDIIEDGLTLKENALIKCRVIHEQYNIPCISDDTGLEVRALQGRPGVLSARYAGEAANSDLNIQKLLFNMQNVIDRRACFRTVICFKFKTYELFFEGTVDGVISSIKRGDAGFGYDPIFIPNGYEKTFAQLPLLEKNKISHRGQAVKKLKNYLDSFNF